MSVEPAVLPERLHALDAVRGSALLLGVVLHACATWDLQSAPGPLVIYYTIHIFRMPAFYLMAGFFGRMLLQRRGARAFVLDRAKRILLVLVLGLPIVEVTAGLCALLGAQPHGGLAYLRSQGFMPAAQILQPKVRPDLAHLWFLYYLLMFYVLALALRALMQRLDSRGLLRRLTDRGVAVMMQGPWAAVLLAVPAILYYGRPGHWNQPAGLPTPSSIVPQLAAFISYLLPFGLGWLLQRQVQVLLSLRESWLMYLVLFAALTALCLTILLTSDTWQVPALHGPEHAIYLGAYMAAGWCGVFAAAGTALRFLSRPSAVTRYLADASYWVYLMHMGPILFFMMLLGPYHLHWAFMLPITVGGTMLTLLTGYHYLVRFTWLGAILNGCRRARTAGPAPGRAAAAP